MPEVFDIILEKVGLKKPLGAQETVGEQWVRSLIPAYQEEGRKQFRYWLNEFNTKLKEPTGSIQITLKPWKHSLREEAFIQALNARESLTKVGSLGEITETDLDFARQNKRGLNVKITPDGVQTYYENPEVTR